ncbi:thioredoxin family protein [Flaviaesturariibacter terrae]
MLFLLAFAALCAFRSPSELPIGSPLPKADVKLPDISGKMLTLQEARGANGLLVMFSCNTCPFVVKNQLRTRDIGTYAQARKLGVVLINSNEAQRSSDDSFDAMKAYAKEQGYKWSYVLDKNSELADAFGATRTPECFLFDKDSKLVYHGAIDDNPGNPEAVSRKHLQAAIDELVTGKEVTVKTTRSVGCSIKRL